MKLKNVLLPLFVVVCLVGNTSTGAITVTTRSQLVNISTRAFVQTGANILDGGFIITGTQPKTVIIRAIGPELTQHGVPNALADPTLELHAAGIPNAIASNDNWQTTIIGGIITSSQVSAIQNSGVAPTAASESAIIATLQPGAYTAIVSGVNNTTGVALVEVYYLETAPLPLTPLTLATTGIDSSSPVSVSFFNGAGFSVSYQAIRAEADGTVVVAVPLYMDPGTNEITAGTVSMILTQGSNSSPPVSLDIQNLPTLDTYGTQLGQISHSFLIMDATLEGRRLNQLQAGQALFNNVDTSTAQSTEGSLLGGAVRARNDVDRILTDNSTIISGGTLPSGTVIQFDRNSLDMMDRVTAVYLTGLAGIVENSNGSVLSQQPSASTGQGGSAFTGQALTLQGLQSLLPLIENSKTIGEIAKATQDALNFKSYQDLGLACLIGATGFVNFANAQIEQNPTVKEVTQQLGAILAVSNVAKDVGTMLGDLQNIYDASKSGNDPALLQAATTELNDTAHKTYFDSVGTALGAAEMYYKDVDLAVGAIQTLGLGLTITQFYHDSTAAKDSFGIAVLVANQVPVFSSPQQGFATIDGTVNISNNQGIAAPQTSLDLCCMNSSDIQGICDPSGECDLFVPLGVQNTAYNNLTLSAFDFITGNTLSSEIVDLSGLNTSQPVQVPTMIGTCDDTDAGNPDGDDPDCD